MSLYACPRHGGYHEHAQFCPACIEYVVQVLRAVSLESDLTTRDNANRCLVRLGRPATRHTFSKAYTGDLCSICDLPPSNEVHR